ncbi:MAG: NusA-like transcription termination signal-binding factor [archaeon]
MITLDQEIIGFINVFERTTNASVKDCFKEEEGLVFVVQPGQVGKAIGKQGSNIRKLGALFKKRIRIIEFNPIPEKFFLSLIYPNRPKKVNVEEDILKVVCEDNKQKGQIFGRDRSNLKKVQDIFNKYFKLKIVLE